MQPTIIFGGQFNKKVLPLIASAKDSIDIVIFDWRFDSLEAKTEIAKFNSEIFRAHCRGVKVRAVVNSHQVCDRIKNLGMSAKVLTTKKLLHTKLLIIDKQHVIVGSHNYTESALSSNYEISVFFDMFETQNELIDYFNILWAS